MRRGLPPWHSELLARSSQWPLMRDEARCAPLGAQIFRAPADRKVRSPAYCPAAFSRLLQALRYFGQVMPGVCALIWSVFARHSSPHFFSRSWNAAIPGLIGFFAFSPVGAAAPCAGAAVGTAGVFAASAAGAIGAGFRGLAGAACVAGVGIAAPGCAAS